MNTNPFKITEEITVESQEATFSCKLFWQLKNHKYVPVEWPPAVLHSALLHFNQTSIFFYRELKMPHKNYLAKVKDIAD